MKAPSAFVVYVRDQLRSWGPVEVRRMFSSQGVFRNGTLIALIRDDTLYSRTDAATVADFTSAGMGPFLYNRGGRQVALAYHAVPADVLDESEILADWARRAYAAALRRAAAKPRAKRP